MSEGFVASENPCCGIHAIAEATCLDFHSVWNVAKFTLQKKASWRGRTTYSERTKVLEALKAGHNADCRLEGLTLIEAAYIVKNNFNNYILDISGHSVAFKDGRFIDQYGSYYPTNYSRRFHRIDHATCVSPVKDFDQNFLEESLWESLDGAV